MTVNLTTRYLGIELANPLVVAACPLGSSLDTARKLQEHGAAALVLPSLFEEQIAHDEEQLASLYDYGTDAFAEALSYFPALGDYRTTTEEYLELVAGARKALSIPVIASLNGFSEGGWTVYAKKIEEAGASALELNIYMVPTDPEKGAAQIEQGYLDLVSSVRKAISIPLAVKIGPFFSAPAHMARALVAAGADGLVIFNRFLQADIDLDELHVTPHLELSTSYEARLPLRWIAILRDVVSASLAATTGVHTSEDVIKLLLAGADVTMLASSLLRKGPAHVATLLEGLRSWMDEKEYSSVEQLRGSLSLKNCPVPEAFERANYVKTLVSYTSEYV